MSAQHTPGPLDINATIVGPVVELRYPSHGEAVRQLHLARERLVQRDALLAIAQNFQITGPDSDGLVWLVLHGNDTTGRAMFQLGSPKRLAVQVALLLEEARRAAIERATGSAS